MFIGTGCLAALRSLKTGSFRLARWLVDPANRCAGHDGRIWHDISVGLVETDNDFGTQGSPPSHPELLDWLASEFIARGWSQKAMHRLIVTSATYRQSSQTRSELSMIDPGNRLLARQSRLRLDAEIIRDVTLSSSGMFNMSARARFALIFADLDSLTWSSALKTFALTASRSDSWI